MSCNVDKDIIDVYLLYNSEKVKSVDPNLQNYYRIKAKDIGVKDDFKELTFVIVNDIQLTIKIKFKNKCSSQSVSIRDRVKFFSIQSDKKKTETQNIPKKLNLQKIFQKK